MVDRSGFQHALALTPTTDSEPRRDSVAVVVRALEKRKNQQALLHSGSAVQRNRNEPNAP
jgi:hypothetical protein